MIIEEGTCKRQQNPVHEERLFREQRVHLNQHDKSGIFQPKSNRHGFDARKAENRESAGLGNVCQVPETTCPMEKIEPEIYLGPYTFCLLRKQTECQSNVKPFDVELSQ
ncbi:hypothetical protein GWI33_000624 [Rhynchophorus ferrugineus]|uniref:Uncharacterized protein n=1 Tax=Rhynchophorus ferrugineus TaxID=354439 RepID=A0A834MGS4_RHYFE|nr:hypothetical protein GWI33_000624 [Rhynchophorus ferrugineus]